MAAMRPWPSAGSGEVVSLGKLQLLLFHAPLMGFENYVAYYDSRLIHRIIRTIDFHSAPGKDPSLRADILTLPEHVVQPRANISDGCSTDVRCTVLSQVLPLLEELNVIQFSIRMEM